MDEAWYGNLAREAPWLDGLTFNRYYSSTRSARHFIESVLRASWLASGHGESARAAHALRMLLPATPPAWLTEVGSSSNSGAPIADSFADALWYADALGAAAQAGLAVVCRQALVGGRYALLRGNTEGVDPAITKPLRALPGFWVALLWRRLMGARVLAVHALLSAPRSVPPQWAANCFAHSSLWPHPDCVRAATALASSGAPPRLALPRLRAYVHCAANGAAARGAVALVLINLNTSYATDASLTQLTDREPWPMGGHRLEWDVWTPNVRSRQTRLGPDGTRLRLRPTERGAAALPAPRRVAMHASLQVRPHSILFVLLPEARAPACFAKRV